MQVEPRDLGKGMCMCVGGDIYEWKVNITMHYIFVTPWTVAR